MGWVIAIGTVQPFWFWSPKRNTLKLFAQLVPCQFYKPRDDIHDCAAQTCLPVLHAWTNPRLEALFCHSLPRFPPTWAVSENKTGQSHASIRILSVRIVVR
jgi:hypothetical protein